MGNSLCCIDSPRKRYKDMTDNELSYEKKKIKKDKNWDKVYIGGYALSIVVPVIVVISGGPASLLIGIGISTIGFLYYIVSYVENSKNEKIIENRLMLRKEANIIKVKQNKIIYIN